MFKNLRIPSLIYDMAQEVSAKKKRKIEKLFEEFVKSEWKKL